MPGRNIAALTLLLFGASRAFALELSSAEIAPGSVLTKAQVYSECGGGNIAPSLAWSGAPAGTRSFAVTLFDPDAHGGWWHWIVYDIPANANGLPGGGALPGGARLGTNDFGTVGYAGACPPPGSDAHHYRFTLWALPVPALPIADGAKGETVGPYLAAHALSSATFTATYER